MLFTLVYTPCLSTIATLNSESKDWRFTVGALGWSLGLAWLLSFAFYQTARALGY
jgi:ferrous iron transport protein B